jgi:hypothetical protein
VRQRLPGVRVVKFSVSSQGVLHTMTCRYTTDVTVEWTEGTVFSVIARLPYRPCGHCRPFDGRHANPVMDGDGELLHPGFDTWFVGATDRHLGMSTGVVGVRVHHPDACVGTDCVVHHPSDHHMRDWRCVWRGDRGIVERICPDHGVGHPDPDDLAFRSRHGDADSVHGCCGCCSTKSGEML